MSSFGNWLRNIRSGRGISQDDFGLSIGRSKSWVADIERSKARPKNEDLPKIARALEVSVHDVYQAYLQDIMGFISAKLREFSPEIAAVAELWASMEAEAVSVERVSPKSRRRIERIAEKLAVFLFPEEVENYEAMPLDRLFYDNELTSRLNTELGCALFFSLCDDSSPFEASAQPASTGGIEVRLRDDVWRLIESGDGRARFTLAHELGHVFLHKDEILAGGVVYRDAACIPSEALQPGMKIYESPEWQANVFASAFLMPRDAVQKWIDYVRCEDPEMVSIASMAEHFGVSYQAARIRMERILVMAF